MPNTLAHLGFQTSVHLLGTRARASRSGILPAGQLPWIALGCVIPDLPWILQRAVVMLLPWIDRYDLRLYAVAQASLAVSLLACAAFSLLSARPRRAFGVLSLNALLHLLLDALQTKWGNGVHLLAPFSWKTWNAELFWPESVVTHALTALGLAVFCWAVRKGVHQAPSRRARGAKPRVAAAFAFAYLVAPLPLSSGAESANSHSVRTLREVAERAGRPVAFDRVLVVHGEAGDQIVTLSGEKLELVGAPPLSADRASIRGRFESTGSVSIEALHEHTGLGRDLPTYVGLGLTAALWVSAFWPRIMSEGRRSQLGAPP